MKKTITITEQEYNAFFKLKYYTQRKKDVSLKNTVYSQVIIEFADEKIYEALEELNVISKERENQLKAI